MGNRPQRLGFMGLLLALSTIMELSPLLFLFSVYSPGSEKRGTTASQG
jgi:hypothetical protein